VIEPATTTVAVEPVTRTVGVPKLGEYRCEEKAGRPASP